MEVIIKRRKSPLDFSLLAILLLLVVHSKSESSKVWSNMTQSDTSNTTRIFVVSNASFAHPRVTTRLNSKSSVGTDDRHLPSMTRYSIDTDITYTDNNINDTIFSIVYDAKKRNDIINRGITYNTNESLLLYTDHNDTRKLVEEDSFPQLQKNVSIDISPTVIVRRQSSAKLETPDIKERTKLRNKDRRKKRKGKKSKSRFNKNNDKNLKYTNHSKTVPMSSKIRLPSSVIPVHYVLRLRPQFDKDFLVQGSVEIEVEVRAATPRIKLHSSKISINKTTVKVSFFKTHKVIPVKNVKFNQRRQFMMVKLRRKLRPGRVYVLSMTFSYHLNEEAKGFYKASYIDQSGEISWLAATQFWPSEARRAFPCFDEPGMKATFDVHLARSENSSSLSNMPLVRSYKTKEEPGWVWDQFATSVNMSTYLLAFAVSEFAFKSNERRNETLIRAWARNTMVNRTSLALTVGRSSLKFFENYFELDFPLPKLDMIALPKMSFNGMENWGLITFKESSFLVDLNRTTAAHSMCASTLIAHEVAHQWFGNLITFEWWNDLWLNEGFATYLSFVAIDNANPSWKVLDHFVVAQLQEVMALDSLWSAHPVSSPVKDPSRINDIFDSIPYAKGASIIRMMKHFLSETTFRKGLKSYLHHFQYKNTLQDDLWNFLTKVAQEDRSLPVGVSVKAIMDTWTLQPGYPLLMVERFDNGTAFLSQKRFTFGRTSSKHKRRGKDSKWWIPITFTTEKSSSFKHTRAQTWLRQEDTSLKVTGLPSRDQWVIFNLQQTGYYRVNYDLATWRLLIKQLNSNHQAIHVTNRAQLIDDSLNLARAGLLPYDLSLQILSYLKYEREYTPWKAGLRNLNYIKTMLQKKRDYGLFKAFLLNLLEPLIEHIGLEPRGNDTMQSSLMRMELISWLCQLEHSFCHEKAWELIQDFSEETNGSQHNLTKFKEPMSVDVLCSAVRRGDQDFWEKIRHFYFISQDIDEKSQYLKALGCTRYVWLLNRYLQLLEEPSSGVLRQDGAQLYKAATQTSVGVYVTWDTFRSSWNRMKEFSDFAFYVAPRIIDTITQSFNTHHHLKELLAFREKVRRENSHMKATFKFINKASPVLPALNNAVSKVEVNIKWMKENYETIIEWFKAHGYVL